MKLEQYLINEKKIKLQDVNKQNITAFTNMSDKQIQWFYDNWPTIEKQCSYYIKMLQKDNPDTNWLIRGSKNSIETGELRVPRKDRKPMSSPIELHLLMDEALERMFGWRPRSEGVFAVGNSAFVDAYGVEHIFLPAGKFKYVWSEGITDVFQKTNVGSFLQHMMDKFPDEVNQKALADKDFQEFVSLKVYKKKDELERMDDKAKLSFVTAYMGSKFDLRDKRRVMPEWLIELTEKTMDDLIKSFKFTDKDFHKILKRKNEISIKCNKYWMLNNDYSLAVHYMIFGDRK